MIAFEVSTENVHNVHLKDTAGGGGGQEENVQNVQS